MAGLGGFCQKLFAPKKGYRANAAFRPSLSCVLRMKHFFSIFSLISKQFTFILLFLLIILHPVLVQKDRKIKKGSEMDQNCPH